MSIVTSKIKVLDRSTPCVLSCSRSIDSPLKVVELTKVATKEVSINDLSDLYINKGEYIVVVNDPDSISDVYPLKVTFNEDPIILASGLVRVSVELVNKPKVAPESIVGNADLFIDSVIKLISDYCAHTTILEIPTSSGIPRLITIRILLLDFYLAHYVMMGKDCIWKNMRYYGDTRLGYKWWNSLVGKPLDELGFENSHTRFLLQVMREGITNGRTRMLQKSIWDRANTILIDNGL